MSLGGSGVVSVVGNIVPADVIAMVDAFNSGDLLTARQLHYRLFPLCRDMLGLSTNPIPVKAAMQLLGRDSGELRLPMTPLTKTEMESLRGSLQSYGLL
jgi:4-hydroxy-tetrahydrodipicolinate synthase